MKHSFCMRMPNILSQNGKKKIKKICVVLNLYNNLLTIIIQDGREYRAILQPSEAGQHKLRAACKL